MKRKDLFFVVYASVWGAVVAAVWCGLGYGWALLFTNIFMALLFIVILIKTFSIKFDKWLEGKV